MKKVYTTNLPEMIISQTIPKGKVPVTSLYKIRGADSRHMQWPTGMIFCQRVIKYDFLVEFYESRLNQDLHIDIVFKRSCIVFCYGFFGQISCLNEEDANLITLPQGQSGAINIPAGRYQLSLSRGWNAGFLYVFDNKYLDAVLQVAPFNFRIADHFGLGFSGVHQFPFFLIGSVGHIVDMFQDIEPGQRSLSIKMCLFKLFKRYTDQLESYRTRPAADAYEKVMSVKKFIETQQLTGPLPAVSEIAQQFHIHPDALNRSFKTTFGIGLKKYMNQTRMHHAFLLISRDRMSVHQVSEYIGYNSPFSFSTQFKLYYGFSPGLLLKI